MTRGWYDDPRELRRRADQYRDLVPTACTAAIAAERERQAAIFNRRADLIEHARKEA